MKLLLADDERLARDRLRRLLVELGDVEVVDEAADGRAALDAIAVHKPDAVFLDIEMPELSGLEVAAALGLGGPPVVFVTAHDDLALRAFEAHALDYLVKPVTRERLASALAKLRLRLGASRGGLPQGPEPAALRVLAAAGRLRRLALRSGTNIHVFDPARISAFIARDRYAEVVCGEELRLVDESLDSLEARLDPRTFLRIHRASIINLEFLREMRRDGDRKYTAVLGDHFGTELAVSRENLERLRAALGT